MGFEEGVDPVDGWSAPRQALVLIATRSLPLWAQIMSAAFSAIMMIGAFVYADVMVSMIEGSSTRRPSSAWPSAYTAAEKCDEFPPPHGGLPQG
jgi:hypothetical protein